jgi:hypothetical protein
MKLFICDSTFENSIKVQFVVTTTNNYTTCLKEVVFYNLNDNKQWKLIDPKRTNVLKSNNNSDEYTIELFEPIKFNIAAGNKLDVQDARILWKLLIENGLVEDYLSHINITYKIV